MYLLAFKLRLRQHFLSKTVCYQLKFVSGREITVGDRCKHLQSIKCQKNEPAKKTVLLTTENFLINEQIIVNPFAIFCT